jgi:hypothetical protein
MVSRRSQRISLLHADLIQVGTLIERLIEIVDCGHNPWRGRTSVCHCEIPSFVALARMKLPCRIQRHLVAIVALPGLSVAIMSPNVSIYCRNNKDRVNCFAEDVFVATIVA